MHATKDRPVVVDGQIVIRPIMVVALTYDHRVLDGREAVTFLGKWNTICRRVQSTDEILVVVVVVGTYTYSESERVRRRPSQDAVGIMRAALLVLLSYCCCDENSDQTRLKERRSLRKGVLEPWPSTTRRSNCQSYFYTKRTLFFARRGIRLYMLSSFPLPSSIPMTRQLNERQ
jgi:2-oxoacid dehydrogenases acyltransferase (catalytic domain)